MSVDIIIGTFGDESWKNKGEELLLDVQKNVYDINNVYAVHGKTLAEARNEGAERSSSQYLIFLDADDNLSSNYVIEMKKVAQWYPVPAIFQPSTIGVYEDGTTDKEPVLIPDRNMFHGNNLVIGSMVVRSDFLDVGGFKELPILEDWELFLNIITSKEAKVVTVPKAVYRVGVRQNSRNTDARLHNSVYGDIVREYSKKKVEYRI